MVAADTTGVLIDYQPRRRPLLIGLIVFGLLATTVGVLKGAEHFRFSPAHTVSAFFHALGDRDATAARALLDSSGEEFDPTLLQPKILRSPGYTPPTGVRVKRVRSIGRSQATADVSFRLGGQRRSLSLTLLRDAHATAGLFHQWRIVGGIYPVEVAAPGVDSVLMAGVPVRLATEDSDSQTSLAALPGGYKVTLPEQPLLEAAPTVAYAGLTDEVATVTLGTSLRSSARAAIDQQVRAFLDGCATSTSLEPDGCPFASFSAFGDVRDVHWKIVTYPDYTVGQDESGQVVVTGTGTGTGEADVTGQEVSAFGTEPFSDEATFSLDGTVMLSGGTITFQYSGAE